MNNIEVLRAYFELTPVVRNVVREFILIIDNPRTSDDDREMAITTINVVLLE